MRWKAVIPLLLIIVTMTLGYILFFDRIVTSLLIQQGESIAEAKVDIESSTLTWSPFGIRINSLAITDKDQPMKNIVEADSIAFGIDISSLVEGKYIIDTVEITGIKTDTNRNVSGALTSDIKQHVPSPPVSSQKTPKEETTTETPSPTQTLDINDYIDISHLESTQQAKHIQKDIDTLKLRFTDLTNPHSFQEKLDSLKKKTKNLNDLNTIKSDIESLKTDLLSQKDELLTETQRIKSEIKKLKDTSKADVNTTLNTFNLTSLSHDNISDTLLSESLQGSLKKGLYVLDIIQRYRSTNKPTEKKATYQGITVEFPLNKNPLPKVWIKTIQLSGSTEKNEKIEGYIHNISSNPDSINLPISYTLSTGSSFTIDGTIDFRNDTLLTNLSFEKQEHISPRSLIKNDTYSITLQNGVITTQGHVKTNESTIQSTLSSKGNQLSFESNNAVLSTSLSHIQDMRITTTITGTLSHPSMSISSDIDQKIENALTKTYNEEIRKQKQALQQRVDASISSSQSDLYAQLSTLSSSINTDLSSQLSEINNIEDAMSTGKTQLKTIIDKEKETLNQKKDDLSKDIEKKAKSLLNDFF